MRHDNPAGAVWKAAGRFIFTAALVAVFLWPLVPEQALAAPQCASYRQMEKFLSERFGEAPRAFGLVGGDRIMQVFIGPKGSWTILITVASSRTCILAAGEGWEDIPVMEPLAVPGDPA